MEVDFTKMDVNTLSSRHNRLSAQDLRLSEGRPIRTDVYDRFIKSQLASRNEVEGFMR